METFELVKPGDILTIETKFMGPYQIRVKEVSPVYLTANGRTRTIVCDQWRFGTEHEWVKDKHTHRVTNKDSITIVKI